MFESCVLQSDILISLDFDADTKQSRKRAVEPVDSSTVGRRKSSTGAAERRCQTPFLDHPHLKLSDIFPTTHTCGKNGPMTFSYSGPLVSCPPQLYFLTPPHRKVDFTRLLTFSFTMKGLTTHFLSHQNCVNRGGCCSFGVVSSKISFCLPPLHLSHTQRSVWTPSH